MSNSIEDNDLDNWCDLVAGRLVKDPNPETVRDANLLKAVLEIHGQQVAKQYTRSDMEAGLKRLLNEVESKNLFTTPNKPKGFIERFRNLLGMHSVQSSLFIPVASAAVLILAVVILIPPKQNSSLIDLERTRGADLKINPEDKYLIRKEVQDPNSSAKDLAQNLLALGIAAKVEGYENGWIVRATLPDPVGEKVKTMLERFPISIPADGKLAVFFISQ